MAKDCLSTLTLCLSSSSSDTNLLWMWFLSVIFVDIMWLTWNQYPTTFTVGYNVVTSRRLFLIVILVILMHSQLTSRLISICRFVQAGHWNWRSYFLFYVIINWNVSRVKLMYTDSTTIILWRLTGEIGLICHICSCNF